MRLTLGSILSSPNRIWAGLGTVTELAKQSSVDECFQSVSNGKTQVANAITDKGVAASGSDSFATLANKISQIQVGLNSIQQQLFSGLNRNITVITMYSSATPQYVYRNGSRVQMNIERGTSNDSDVMYWLDYGNYGFSIITNEILYNPYSGQFVVRAPTFSDAILGTPLSGSSLNSYSSHFDVASACKITTVNVTFSPQSPWAIDSSGTKTGTFTLAEYFPRTLIIESEIHFESGNESFTI